MDSQRLKSFTTVATLLNFNQAAKVLNFAQSTISAQIKSLEDEVGVLLFKRIGKKVFLTEAGERMLGYAQKILSLEEEAVADITGQREPVGTLTLKVPYSLATYRLPRVLSEFQPRFPKISFDVSSCITNTLEHELQIGKIDLAFLLTQSIQAANIRSEFIRTETLALVSYPNHPLSKKTKVDFGDLHGETIFLPKADCGYGIPFGQALAAHMIEPAAILEFSSIEAIKNIVSTGMGVMIIPKIAVKNELDTNQLVELPWVNDIEVAVLMVWHKSKQISPALQAFMDLARTVMGSD